MNMREKIARAIWESRLTDEYGGVSFEHAMSRPRYTHIKEYLERQTDAVFAVLSEPTLEMVEAMRREIAK